MADDSLNFNITANTSDLEASLQSIVAGLSNVSSSAESTGATLAEGMNEGAAATEKLTASTKEASAEMAEGATVAERFATAIEDVGAHARTVSSGLEALGLSAEGSAARIVGMTEALSGLGAAVPELLVLAAAFAAVAGALDFFKEATVDAEAMQNSMATLGAAVASQGGNWSEDREQVEQWTDSLSLASGVLASQLVPALDTLVSAGNSLADSERILYVATELAAQKHIELTTAVNALERAELGRYGGLEKLDGSVKHLADTHQTYSTILQQVDKDTNKAITDNDSAAMAQARMRAEIEKASDTIGQLLLPVLRNLAITMVGAIENAIDLGRAIAQAFQGTVGAISNAAQAAYHFAAAMADFQSGNFKGAMGEFHSATASVGHAWNDATTAIKGFGAAAHEVFQGEDATKRGSEMIQKAIKDSRPDNFNVEGLPSDAKEKKGKKGHKPSEAGANEAADLQPENLDAVADAWDKYDAILAANAALTDNSKTKIEALNEKVSDAERAVKLATTTEGEEAAQKALAQAKTEALTGAVQIYSAELSKSESAVKSQSTATYAANLSFTEAKNTLHNYELGVKAHGTATQADKAEIDKLKASVEDARKKDEDAISALEKKSAALKKSTEDLGAAKKAQQEYADATAEANAKASRDLETFYAKEAETKQKEIELLGKTNAQKLDYYAADYAAQVATLQKMNVATDAAYAQQAQTVETAYKALEAAQDTYDKSILEAQQKTIEAAAEARKKALAEATKDVDSFLGDILDKHESFGSSLKSLMSEISKQYAQSISSMITGSSWFQKAFGGALPGGGNQTSPQAQQLITSTQDQTKATTALTQPTTDLKDPVTDLKQPVIDLKQPLVELKQPTLDNTTALQNLTAQLKSSATSGGSSGQSSGFFGIPGLGGGSSSGLDLTSPFDTSTQLPSLDLSPNAIQQITGVPGGINSSSVTALSNSSTPSEYTADMDDAAGGDFSPLNTKNGTMGYIQGGLSLLQGLSGGGTASKTLGGVGEIAGTIFGGPIGGAIGSTLGSLIGSFFGPHPTAAKDPDMFESQTGYGQDIADIENGPAAASGVNYSPNSAVSAFAAAMGVSPGTINNLINGGQQKTNTNGTIQSSGGVDAAEIWLSQNQSDTAAQLQALGVTQAEITQWTSLLGSSATGSGQLGLVPGDPNIGDRVVTGAGTGGGVNTTYTALESAIQGIIGAYNAGGGSTGVYSLTHSFPNGLGPVMRPSIYVAVGSFRRERGIPRAFDLRASYADDLSCTLGAILRLHASLQISCGSGSD